jgi:hypothetical protein
MKPDWDRLGEFFGKPDSQAQIFDVDCTVDAAKGLCEEYGVKGYPTIKWFKSTDPTDQGESYDGGREYNDFKKFAKRNSKPPCNSGTLENCNKKEKDFIEELKAWDDAKIEEEKKSIKDLIDEATAKHKAEGDLFEEQKDVAMATMKRQEEAKKELDALTKANKYKLLILEQGKPEVKSEL